GGERWRSTRRSALLRSELSLQSFRTDAPPADTSSETHSSFRPSPKQAATQALGCTRDGSNLRHTVEEVEEPGHGKDVGVKEGADAPFSTRKPAGQVWALGC